MLGGHQHLLKIAGEGGVILPAPVEEGGGEALMPRTPGAADPVRVVFDIHWCIVVDHVCHFGHIDATPEHIGTNQDANFIVFEGSEGPLSLSLLLVTMDCSRRA